MSLTQIFAIAHDTPWKLGNEVFRLLFLPFVWMSFRLNGIAYGKGWKIYGLPILQIHRGSQVEIGDYLELRSSVCSNPLAPFHPVVISTRSKNAILKIGDHFSMTGGSLVAEESITIGNNVMVGANSVIMDTDFHQLFPNKKVTKPVNINDGVFLGTQSIVLKGSHLGKKSIVGAGTVVSGFVEARSTIISNHFQILSDR